MKIASSFFVFSAVLALALEASAQNSAAGVGPQPQQFGDQTPSLGGDRQQHAQQYADQSQGMGVDTQQLRGASMQDRAGGGTARGGGGVGGGGRGRGGSGGGYGRDGYDNVPYTYNHPYQYQDPYQYQGHYNYNPYSFGSQTFNPSSPHSAFSSIPTTSSIFNPSSPHSAFSSSPTTSSFSASSGLSSNFNPSSSHPWSSQPSASASILSSYCKNVAEFLHLSDTSVCASSATTATGGVASPTPDEEDGLTFSTEIFLCPKQKLFIQTCAKTKSILNVDVQMLLGAGAGVTIDPTTTVTSTAAAEVTVSLDSIEITDCDGDWEESFEPNDEFVMIQRNSKLSHTQEFGAVAVTPVDLNSLLSLDEEYTDNSCVAHMYEADDHFYGKCTLKWQFSAECSATAAETVSTGVTLADLKDPAAHAQLQSLVATAVIQGNLPSQYQYPLY